MHCNYSAPIMMSCLNLQSDENKDPPGRGGGGGGPEPGNSGGGGGGGGPEPGNSGGGGGTPGNSGGGGGAAGTLSVPGGSLEERGVTSEVGGGVSEVVCSSCNGDVVGVAL